MYATPSSFTLQPSMFANPMKTCTFLLLADCQLLLCKKFANDITSVSLKKSGFALHIMQENHQKNVKYKVKQSYVSSHLFDPQFLHTVSRSRRRVFQFLAVGRCLPVLNLKRKIRESLQLRIGFTFSFLFNYVLIFSLVYTASYRITPVLRIFRGIFYNHFLASHLHVILGHLRSFNSRNFYQISTFDFGLKIDVGHIYHYIRKTYDKDDFVYYRFAFLPLAALAS